MLTLVTTVHIITCVLLVLVVLVQSGKGAEISASFGGSSQTVFGSSGGANFFTRFTGGAAALFMCTSIFLTIHGSAQSKGSVFDKGGVPVPAATAPLNTAPSQGAAATTSSTTATTTNAAPAAPTAK